MQANVTEIATDTFRISTYHTEYGLQFNQFLIVDEQPFLMHTGFRKMLQSTLEGVRHVIDPQKIRWIGFSHFEPDECGALNEWLALAPDAQPVTGMVGSIVMMDDYADRPARALSDQEILPIGRHRLRFLATPHVPHCWDAGLFFDEREKTLFCSDLFHHGGNPEAVTESDIVGRTAEEMKQIQHGPLAHYMPYTPHTENALQRLAVLGPATLAIMHGSTYRGDARRALQELAVTMRETFGGNTAQ